jgi:hypothetical protein
VSALVSTLVNEDLRGGRYLFALIAWNDYGTDVHDEFTRQAQAFGLHLGDAGTLVQPYPQHMYGVAKQVLDKPWPPEIRDRFHNDQDPVMLILEKAWREFDPTEHPYAVIWLSDFNDDPKQIKTVLGDLARRTRDGEDVIAYLLGVARRARRDDAVADAKQALGILARLGSYFEIKPQLFGVAVDIKAILHDIAEHRAGRS